MAHKIYELKKDIVLPGGYYRAGTKKTAKQWQKEFGKITLDKEPEWFIDISKAQDKQEPSMLNAIIDEIFKQHGLYSITYKEAAAHVAVRYANYLSLSKK